MERLPELVKGYALKDVLHMDKLGLNVKALPQKGLVEKEKKGRGENKVKSDALSHPSSVAANGSKVCDPIVVWRSKKPRCFKKSKNIYHLHGVHYFGNAKAWITTEIMQEILKMLDEKMIAEGRNIFAFLRQRTHASRHSSGRFKNIKMEFLPKNTTSRMQSCNAGIIKNFKHKYRRLLISLVSTVNRTATKIIKDVTILKVIEWIQTSWADVSEKTIKNCFEKCGFL